MAAEGGIELVSRLLKYNEEVRNARDQPRPGWILMVPKIYRDLSPHSFTPRVVSIGPLHHKDEHLKVFEVKKAAYIHDLFRRIRRPPDEIYQECLTKVRRSLDQIRACYIGMEAYPDDAELVNMMATDACFILAFIDNMKIKYSSLGPIELLYLHIFHDMILIENQIPFFVLQDIFDSTLSKHDPGLTLGELIFPLRHMFNIFDGELLENSDKSTTDVHHILGFLHKYYQKPHNPQSLESLENPKDKIVRKGHSVVELDRAGVRFSNNRDEMWPMAMELEFSKFPCFPNLSWSKPTLKMPVLIIQDNLELILRNLVMYELFFSVQGCVRSYIYALDFLIDTPQDVAKLVRSKALINILGSDEEAVGIINNIGKQVTVNDFYYQDQWNKLDGYYNAKWPKFIAELRRTYFNNPWTIIAVIAGIVLFVLTVVQTILTAIQTVYAIKAA